MGNTLYVVYPPVISFVDHDKTFRGALSLQLLVKLFLRSTEGVLVLREEEEEFNEELLVFLEYGVGVEAENEFGEAFRLSLT